MANLFDIEVKVAYQLISQNGQLRQCRLSLDCDTGRKRVPKLLSVPIKLKNLGNGSEVWEKAQRSASLLTEPRKELASQAETAREASPSRRHCRERLGGDTANRESTG